MAETNISIRLAIETDVSAIEACARAAYAKYLPRMDRTPAPMVADFRAQVAAGQVHVAELDSNVVGYAVFYPQDQSLHLENIAVSPAQAGHGIGGVLIRFVEDSARKRGLDAVELYTNEAMTENLAMYPKLGYEEVERRSQDGFSRVFFRKPVTPAA